RDEKFEKTYQVSVLDFSYYQTDDYHSSFSFRKNDTFELLDDALSIHVFELPKVPDEPNPEDPAIEWFQVVKADSEEALKKIEARTKNPTILKAIEAARQLNADETLRRAR
ncbi:MAG: PD-(D/E)XK nuclease family transposase, partial [Thermoguttaceae bacterium]|nr:PD-(D/E)XK nuclease family transposase [Thermoguttaceae bacterium]